MSETRKVIGAFAQSHDPTWVEHIEQRAHRDQPRANAAAAAPGPELQPVRASQELARRSGHGLSAVLDGKPPRISVQLARR